jgi:hypothetical protein
MDNSRGIEGLSSSLAFFFLFFGGGEFNFLMLAFSWLVNMLKKQLAREHNQRQV